MEGNERIAALMREAGFLKDDGSVGLKVFARAVSRFGPRAYTHTYVRRWLEGKVPRDPQTRHAIAAALGDRLGRTISVDELGFGRSETLPADLGLHYPSTPAEGITAVTRLWQADLDHAHALLTVPANSAAWNEAALSWVVSSAADAPFSSTGSRQVGGVDVARIRTTTELFERLDAQYGGGHARTSLIDYLHNDLSRLLRGTYTDETGRELFRASAQATMLAAWMSYDSGLHGLAQRYFVQALKLADASGDRLLAGGILDAMSHQATFLGRYREAANLARAARTGTESLGSATLAAHFHAMEARALARLGDASACDRAMAAAVREFERRRPEDDPDWFQYFDGAELAAELGHCNRDLGRAVQASTFAAQSVGVNGEQVRSDFFATMVLADAYLDQGEAEQACHVAMTALEIGEQLKSARCAAYVDEFRQRLDRVGNSPVVRDFHEQAAHTRLWTPDGARTVPSRGGSRRS
jgi:tetratricopeptide (TPR) repeat protein